ncbi:MAG: thiamine-phosphate kinase [Candidatus Diapherotrites archaeon]|nr:thiamine-phosphate kinase [Candidatus Micrarchaeota archaeon]
MTSKQALSEHELIARISRPPRDKNVIVGIGDDCAVLRWKKNKHLLLSTDAMVEGDHFTRTWFTPKQVGMKAVESNVSDIAAMGGTARHILISLAMPKDTSLDFIDGLYSGIYSSAGKYNVDVIGGNITNAKQISITITVLGEVKPAELCLRSSAKPGDLIMVSGPLGKGAAGLNLFRKKIKGHDIARHAYLEPLAQLTKARHAAKYVNAMEDISDGLASEVRNICTASRVGAVIYVEKVPLATSTIKAAKAARNTALDYALYGGEDFELVYTVPKKNIRKVKGIIVGKITHERKIMLEENGKKTELTKFGYDHLK